MVEVVTIIKKIDKCDKDTLFTIQQTSRTREHNQKILKKKQFRLELRKHFFSQRVINDWNNLSDELINSESVNQVKSKLNKFWKDIAIKFAGPDLEGGHWGTCPPRRSASGLFCSSVYCFSPIFFSMSRALNERKAYILLNCDCQMSIISPLAIVYLVIIITRCVHAMFLIFNTLSNLISWCPVDQSELRFLT